LRPVSWKWQKGSATLPQRLLWRPSQRVYLLACDDPALPEAHSFDLLRTGSRPPLLSLHSVGFGGIMRAVSWSVAPARAGTPFGLEGLRVHNMDIVGPAPKTRLPKVSRYCGRDSAQVNLKGVPHWTYSVWGPS